MSIEQRMRDQGGLISRRQVLSLGGNDNLIERRVRRREWRVVHPGVYVDHTGPPTDEQLRMAAVLYAAPAALAAESALIAHGVRNITTDLVTVAVPRARRVHAQPAMRVVRMSELDSRTMWHRTPPRLRLEDATLQVASMRWARRGEADAVALLSDVCQQRRSTADRLLTTLSHHPYLPGRAFLRTVLDDVSVGAFSLLEHRYLTRVERPHGLPAGRRQRGFTSTRGPGCRDVLYPAYLLVVELDGRLGHEWATDQWADLERDLATATDRLQTIRLGWGAVADACSLAPMVGELLRTRGWDGRAHPCRRCPRVL